MPGRVSARWRCRDCCEAADINPAGCQAAATCRRKAKSVIYLFMHGGVSHVDTFDPKPELTKRSGQPLSVELAKTIKTSFIHDPTKADPARQSVGVQARRQMRHSGFAISSRTSRERMDDIAVIRGCYGDVFDHAPAIYLRNSGSQFPGTSVPGFLGHLRSGNRESESAGVCRDVGRIHQVRAPGV